ncbi:Hypothetical predicted protein [Paramuricea clavata]|uniref:Uncharacterized protein n=1 Tax=Paramuricea clavata TaxID=317549 RepID=A0A6S7HG34_PARCT|nr:Hypothetical predicted protein [Paramuricea clavata]
MKQDRTSAKRALTKKHNEIKQLILDPSNASEISKKMLHLETAIAKFSNAHKLLRQNLHDEDDIQESNDYFNTEMDRITDLKQNVNECNERLILVSDIHDVRPEDSVSSVGLRQKSHARNISQRSMAGSNISGASTSSSISLSKAKAAAKKARLQAQAASFRKKRSLQEEQFHLQRLAEELELETQLAMATAEENAYVEAEKMETTILQQMSDKPTRMGSSQREYDVRIQSDARNVVESPNVNECERVDTSPDQTSSNEVRKRNADVVPDKNLEATRKQRDDDNAQFERFLQTQEQSANALMLPKPEVPVFSGDPIDYQTFIRAFENLIETNTDSNSARLYYLIQYTQGDVKELMKSCLSMKSEEGYAEARRLLKRRYDQDYKIAASYVDRVTTGPMIKSENAAALQRFSILLTSCKNMLRTIGYSSKQDNPDSFRKIIERLPYGMRKNWRDVVDKITEKESREITIDDIAAFVEAKARASSHPIFGNL